MCYDRLNFKIQIDNEEQLIMSQAESDNSVIMNLEEYDFSVQPPRLRSRHVSTSLNKMLEPTTYDGTTSAEWSEYIIHFVQIAERNNWSESQKAKMLTIKLRGEA